MLVSLFWPPRADGLVGFGLGCNREPIPPMLYKRHLRENRSIIFRLLFQTTKNPEVWTVTGFCGFFKTLPKVLGRCCTFSTCPGTLDEKSADASDPKYMALVIWLCAEYVWIFQHQDARALGAWSLIAACVRGARSRLQLCQARGVLPGTYVHTSCWRCQNGAVPPF